MPLESSFVGNLIRGCCLLKEGSDIALFVNNLVRSPIVGDGDNKELCVLTMLIGRKKVVEGDDESPRVFGDDNEGSLMDSGHWTSGKDNEVCNDASGIGDSLGD